jgi:hypothetical protein
MVPEFFEASLGVSRTNDGLFQRHMQNMIHHTSCTIVLRRCSAYRSDIDSCIAMTTVTIEPTKFERKTTRQGHLDNSSSSEPQTRYPMILYQTLIDRRGGEGTAYQRDTEWPNKAGKVRVEGVWTPL